MGAGSKAASAVQDSSGRSAERLARTRRKVLRRESLGGDDRVDGHVAVSDDVCARIAGNDVGRGAIVGSVVDGPWLPSAYAPGCTSVRCVLFSLRAKESLVHPGIGLKFLSGGGGWSSNNIESRLRGPSTSI